MGTENKAADGRDGMPLRAHVANGQLVISIGIDTLTWAFHHGESNNPFDDESNKFLQQLTIKNPLVFAEDVCLAMNDEAEDGSTPLTRFLDKMMESAVEQGSLGIADPED
jgi:hypothetical protein